ncbi:hypothetical protein [Thermocatellispora tengchongensis]
MAAMRSVRKASRRPAPELIGLGEMTQDTEITSEVYDLRNIPLDEMGSEGDAILSNLARVNPAAARVLVAAFQSSV